MTEVASPAVAGWSDDDLRHTAGANFGLGTDSGVPDPVRFLIGVARTIRRRQQHVGVQDERTPAVFFLRPTAPRQADHSSLKVQPMLDNGLTQLGGSFWFVGPPVCSGTGLALADWSDDGNIFEKATGELGLGEVPAVFFDPRGKVPTLRHYPRGLGEADVVSVSSLAAEEIDIDRIIEIVDDAHSTHLAGPSGGASLWKDAGKRRASDGAEKSIQFALKVALHHALPTAVVREEQSQMSGRLDLEIEEPLMEEGEFVRHAILELKVLRSYGSTGAAVSTAEIRKIVKEGVQQAIAYREERSAKAAALCCFDMRVNGDRKQCFNGVRATAKRDGLELCVWPIFASAKELRAEMAIS